MKKPRRDERGREGRDAGEEREKIGRKRERCEGWERRGRDIKKKSRFSVHSASFLKFFKTLLARKFIILWFSSVLGSRDM